MLDALTDDHINHYRKQGYVAVEGFIDGEELERWRRVTDGAVAERLASAEELTNQKKDEDPSYYSRVFVQCIRLADTNDEMRGLIYDERIGRIAATLEGIDGIRVWHDQALFKEPSGGFTPWHCAPSPPLSLLRSLAALLLSSSRRS